MLRPGGLVGFSTMQHDFPAGGRILRECAAASGVELPNPNEPLGTAVRCRAETLGGGLPAERVVACLTEADERLFGPPRFSTSSPDGPARTGLPR